jgi:HEAT repeat protein
MRYVFPSYALLLCVVGLACNKQAEQPPATTKKTTTTVATPTYDLSSLASDLKSTTAEKRDRALRSAVELDEAETDVVPTLLEALKDPSGSTTPGGTSDRPTSTRETAVQALLKLGSKGKKALTSSGLKTLVEGTKDSKASVREHAVNAIGMVGPDAKIVVNDVVMLCADKDSHVRAATYRALQKIKNPPAVAIVKLLTNTEAGIASDAAGSLSWVKPSGAEAMTLLLEALKYEPAPKNKTEEPMPKDKMDPLPSHLTYVRNCTAEAIAANGKDAEAAIPGLVELLKKTSASEVEKLFQPGKPGTKRTFSSGPVSALRKIGKPALPALLPLLKDEQKIVRYQAAIIVGGMGQDSDEAKEALLAALEIERGLPTADLIVFEELALGAIDLGCDQAKITTQVAKLLGEDDAGVRFRAAFMIARLGRSAAVAVEKLKELLNDVPQIQIAALEAFAAIGPASKAALPEIIKKIEGDDSSVARAATKVVRSFGTDGATAVPALIKALDANDSNFCVEVIQTIGDIGPAAVEAVPALTKMLDAENTRTDERLEILQTLAALGPVAKSALPAIMKYTTAKEFTVRSASATALGKIGPGNAEVLKKLSDMLKDGQALVRVSVIKAIASQGNAAKSLSGEIKTMADKVTVQEVKIWAAAALVSLGTDTENNLKVIREALQNKKPDTTSRVARKAGLEATAFLGTKARGTMPDILDALKDKAPYSPAERFSIRERAAKAVIPMGESAKEATTPLLDLLRDPDLNTRKAAAEALGAIGPSALLAVPKLRELARNDAEAALVANKALDLIVPPKKLD